MTDYTPTTEEVRARFAIVPDQHDGYVESAAFYEAFDRWLAEHDRQVKAEAWAEGYRDGADGALNDCVITPYPNPGPYNPYLTGD